MSAEVLSPRQAAEILGVHHTTVRRWVAEGACPNVFANLPGTRVGIPAWWVEQLISPEPPVVVGLGERSRPESLWGGTHPRTDAGVSSSGAA